MHQIIPIIIIIQGFHCLHQYTNLFGDVNSKKKILINLFFPLKYCCISYESLFDLVYKTSWLSPTVPGTIIYSLKYCRISQIVGISAILLLGIFHTEVEAADNEI